MKTRNQLNEFASDILMPVELPEIVGGIESVEKLDDPEEKFGTVTEQSDLHK